MKNIIADRLDSRSILLFTFLAWPCENGPNILNKKCAFALFQSFREFPEWRLPRRIGPGARDRGWLGRRGIFRVLLGASPK